MQLFVGHSRTARIFAWFSFAVFVTIVDAVCVRQYAVDKSFLGVTGCFILKAYHSGSMPKKAVAYCLPSEINEKHLKLNFNKCNNIQN